MNAASSLLIALSGLCMSACSTSGSASNANADSGAYSTIVFLDAGPATPDSPDGGPACPAGCNYQTQQGCAPGQMCHPQAGDAGVSPQCMTAGPKAAGEPCQWLQCQAGFICAADGHCRHMCCGADWSVCASQETCSGTILLQLSDAGPTVPAGVSVCESVDNCDVFDATTCPIAESCYIVDSRGGLKCLPTGAVAVNGTCSSIQLCAAGLTCVESETAKGGLCRRLCRAVVGGGLPGCPMSEGYCAHFVRDPPGVGECTPTN